MERLPKLEIIVCQGVGYDAIDVAYAAERGIPVTNTPDVLNDAVAELALGLMVGLCRRLPQVDRYVRDGGWLKGNYPLTAQIAGASAGILGLGRIGKEIAARCVAFKMDVAYHGRTEQTGQPYRYYADLVAMAREVDWLVVIAPGSDATRGIVSRAVMEALGPQGCLVNVARGSLVDEPALVELLQAGKLGGAALDVFADEPLARGHPFWRDPRIIITPHVASVTHARTAAKSVAANVRRVESGEPLENLVDLERGY